MPTSTNLVPSQRRLTWTSIGLMAGLVLATYSVASVGTLPLCSAQVKQPEGTVSAYEPESEAFKSANNELREVLKLIRHLIVRFHTSESPATDKEIRAELRELLMKGSEVNSRWVEAAVAEYREDPQSRQALADMLYRLLEQNTEEDRYQGMLELGKLLLETGYEKENLDLLVAKAAYGSNDFDVFKKHVAILLSEGMELSDEYQMIYLNIEQVQDAWEKELAARRADAEGEPLPRVLIKTTKGDIEVELFEDQAPEAVANFIHLIEQNYYDNLSFHRVLKHFMAQGGCPIGDGTGGPEWCIPNEASRPDARMFFSGTLGVALSQHPDSGGSQFFITFVPTPVLNGNYTAFGRVLRGGDALASITRIDPEKKEEGQPAPIPDEILDIEILSKRDHPYVPTKLDPKKVMGTN